MSNKSKEEPMGAEELQTPAAVLERLRKVTGEARLREWLKNASIQDKSPEYHVSLQFQKEKEKIAKTMKYI